MKYRVYLELSFRDWIVVEAENPDEAEEKALDELHEAGQQWDEVHDICVEVDDGAN